MDMKLQVLVLPVAGVERANVVYAGSALTLAVSSVTTFGSSSSRGGACAGWIQFGAPFRLDGTGARASGPAPDDASCSFFATASVLGGNGWLFPVTRRLPGWSGAFLAADQAGPELPR